MTTQSMLARITSTTDKPRNLTWIIFGEPKVGKTTLAATFPRPLLVDIEGGAAFIECPQFPLRSITGCTAHEALQKLYAELRDTAERTFYTIIFDTIDELWNVLARPYKKDGKLPLSQYQPLYDTFLGIVDAFRSLGMDVVFTSHVKHDTDEDGRATATDIKLPGQLQAMLTAKVDEIIYLTVTRRKIDEAGEDAEGNRRQARIAVCQPVDHPKLGTIRAGDRSGRLPETIIDPTYEALSAAKVWRAGLFDGMGDLQPEPETPPETPTFDTSKCEEYIMPEGKHKGKPLSEVPLDALAKARSYYAGKPEFAELLANIAAVFACLEPEVA